jgi:hypothetical protein
MADIYIVIIEDRHADTEAVPFTDEDAAVAHAEEYVAGCDPDPEDIERELNDAMRRVGWVWYCGYSCEGDSVRVVRRELRGTQVTGG